MSLKGRLLLPTLVATAAVGAYALLAAFALCALCGDAGKRFYRARIARGVAWAWFTFAAACVELLGDVSIEVVDDPTTTKNPLGVSYARRLVAVCNHHCTADWLFLWSYACRVARQGDLVIVSKASLKVVPLFGWAMQAFGFVFLTRSAKSTDLERLRSRLAARRVEDVPSFVLVFPEGSDLSPSNVEKAQKFGATMRPPVQWSQVLIPRAAGTRAAVEALGADAVVDLTVRYVVRGHPPERPSISKVLAKGVFPEKMTVDVALFAVSDLPLESDDAFKTWLLERWARKEAELSRDDNNNNNNNGGSSSSSSSRARRRDEKPSAYMVALLAWPAAVLAAATLLWHSAEARLATAVLTVGWFVVTHACGGLDALLLPRALTSAGPR